MNRDQGPLHNYLCIVLAAGLGKRLEPATLLWPKPVLPLGGEPLCLGTLRLLTVLGAQTIHINTSHLGGTLEAALRAAQAEGSEEPAQSDSPSERASAKDKDDQADQDATRPKHGRPDEWTPPGQTDPREQSTRARLARLRFWHESPRLETGGALARIWQELLREGLDPKGLKGVLVVSGDLVCEIPVKEMLSRWEALQKGPRPPGALMVTLPDPGGRRDMTWIEANSNQIVGFGPKPPEGVQEARSVLYASFKVVAPESMPNAPEDVRFALAVELLYGPLVRKGPGIHTLPLDPQALYFNIGTPQEYEDARKALEGRSMSSKLLLRRPQLDTWSGEVLVVKGGQPDHSDRASLHQTILGTCPVERSPVTPLTIGSETHGLVSFEEGVFKLLSLITSAPTAKGPLEGSLCDQAGLIILIKLSNTFPVQFPQAILVGGGLFVGLALSQRESLQGPGEWCSLLLVPEGRGR